jgi:saccharopine dehydrogenase (NAD+, L-lysine forming)
MDLPGREILIAGGYGLVGSRIAAELAVDYPGRVIVAGRDLARAQALAAALGQGVRGRALDVSAPASIAAALDGVGLVMSCIDQPGRLLLHAAIERGLGYTDIAPRLVELGRGAAFEKIDAAAQASGARLVLGSGLVPGISNLMARALAQRLGGADTIETSLLLSASDATGPASMDYFLQELVMPFDIHVHGLDRPARAFSEPRLVCFPAPLGERTAYLFPFSDQVLYPRTMGAHTALTRLAIEPRPVAWLLATLVRTGAAHLVASKPVRQAIARRRSGHADGASANTVFALSVEVTHGGQTGQATLLGPHQAQAAAAGAAAVLRALLEGQVAMPGAWMPEQLMEPAPVFASLAAQGLRVEIHAPTRQGVDAA